MREFASIGKEVCLRNIGIVKRIELPVGMKRDDIRKWMGEEVEIDEKIYKVYGIESQCTIFLPKGTTVGILIESWREKL